MVIRRRLNITGRATVFITTTVVEHIPLFHDSHCAEAVLRQFEETVTHFDATVIACVLMSSHLHALIGFNRVENMSRMLQSFKSLSSRVLKELIPPHQSKRFSSGGKFGIWKPRYDDVVIWSEKQFRVKTEYIHNNPVKSGLVSNSVEYPYSSAGDWLLGKPGLVRIDKNWTWVGEDSV